jgi:secondary thiamine-phosphate synthase enzyme
MWIQRFLKLSKVSRGCHLITPKVLHEVPELPKIKIGLLHVFIQHTSASLTINENADPDVRHDMEIAMNRVVPENQPFRHTIEGPDDMPAHVKSSLIGNSLTIPISNGSLALGTWQGIYLCEHRDQATPRQLVLTLWGEGT